MTVVLSTDTLYIDWAVINNGTGAIADTFFTKVYVDGVERQSWNTPPPLNVNDSAHVTDYSIGSLSAGTHSINVVTDVTGAVQEGNESDNEYTKAITVQPPLDTISPTIVITSPTSESTYTTTSGSLNLGGTASDNVGVTQVTWSNSRGGSGTATGTTSWSVGGITLQSGTNVIAVTARDAANNTGTDTITVTYNPPDSCIAIVSSERWKGEYYNNKDLSGSFSMVRDDGNGIIDFDWVSGSPGSACGIGNDNFSVRWTRTVNFNAGTYSFTVTSDDGFRLYVDNILRLDYWIDQAPDAHRGGAAFGRNHDKNGVL